MAPSLCNASTGCALNDKNEGNSLRYGLNSCLQMETIIQTLKNDIKTLTEIIKIFSEEWRNCRAKEEVRSYEGHYTREDIVGDSPSCNCKNIKTQFCEVQKEYSSLTTRTNILKEDLKHIRQASNFKLSHNFSNKKENQGNSPVPPTNTDDNYYTVSTNNRFTILSNYPDQKVMKLRIHGAITTLQDHAPQIINNSIEAINRRNQHKEIHL